LSAASLDGAFKLALARAMAVAGIPPLQFWTSGMLVAGLAKCSTLKRVKNAVLTVIRSLPV